MTNELAFFFQISVGRQPIHAMKERETDRQTDRQTDSQTETDWQTDKPKQTERHRLKQTETHRLKQTERQTETDKYGRADWHRRKD